MFCSFPKPDTGVGGSMWWLNLNCSFFTEFIRLSDTANRSWRVLHLAVGYDVSVRILNLDLEGLLVQVNPYVRGRPLVGRPRLGHVGFCVLHGVPWIWNPISFFVPGLEIFAFYQPPDGRPGRGRILHDSTWISCIFLHMWLATRQSLCARNFTRCRRSTISGSVRA